MIGKRGVVGEGITWFWAFLVIFFILFVFFFSSIFIKAGQRVLKFEDQSNYMAFAKMAPAVMNTNLNGNNLEIAIIGYLMSEIIAPSETNLQVYDSVAEAGGNIYDVFNDYLPFKLNTKSQFEVKFVR